MTYERKHITPQPKPSPSLYSTSPLYDIQSHIQALRHNLYFLSTQTSVSHSSKLLVKKHREQLIEEIAKLTKYFNKKVNDIYVSAEFLLKNFNIEDVTDPSLKKQLIEFEKNLLKIEDVLKCNLPLEMYEKFQNLSKHMSEVIYKIHMLTSFVKSEHKILPPEKISILQLLNINNGKKPDQKVSLISYDAGETVSKLSILSQELRQLKIEYHSKSSTYKESSQILSLLQDLDDLNELVSGTLFNIPYLSDSENIVFAHQILEQIALFQVELNRKIPKIGKDKFSLDIKILIALFLDIDEFLENFDPVLLCIFFPVLPPKLYTELTEHRWSSFWVSTTAAAYSLPNTLKPAHDKKEVGFSYFQKRSQIHYQSLQKYFEVTGKKTYPFKNIRDIQKFLRAVENGNIVLLLKYYSHLGYKEIETILPVEYDPIKIANKKLNATQDPKYQSILNLFTQMLLTEYQCLTKTLEGNILINQNKFWNKYSKKLIPKLIECRQQTLLDSIGIFTTNLIQEYKELTCKHTIISGNLQFFRELMESKLDLQICLPPTNIRPLFFAIQQRQFAIAKLIYDEWYNQKNIIPTISIHQNVFLEYIEKTKLLSEDIFSALIDFIEYCEISDEIKTFFINYYFIYQEFINSILSKNTQKIHYTLTKLNEPLKKYGDPSIIIQYWIINRCHESLNNGNIFQFFVFAPPKIALNCIQTLMPIFKFSSAENFKKVFENNFFDSHRNIDSNLFISIYRSIDIIWEKNLTQTLFNLPLKFEFISTLQIAAMMACKYKDISFLELMFKEGADKEYLFRNQENILLLMALKENKFKYIDFAFKLDAKICNTIMLAIQEDRNKIKNFTTLICLNHYINFLATKDSTIQEKDLQKIKHNLLNESLFECKNFLCQKPFIFLVIENKNLNLLEALFHLGMQLNPKPLTDIENFINPLTLAIDQCNIDMVTTLIRLGQKATDSAKNIFSLRSNEQFKLREFYQILVESKKFTEAAILNNFLKFAVLEYNANFFWTRRIDITDIEKHHRASLKALSSIQSEGQLQDSKKSGSPNFCRSG